MPRLACHVGRVIRRAANEQMGWADTERDVAGVAYELTIGELPAIGKLPGKATGNVVTLEDDNAPVSVRPFAAGPQPAIPGLVGTGIKDGLRIRRALQIPRTKARANRALPVAGSRAVGAPLGRLGMEWFRALGADDLHGNNIPRFAYPRSSKG